MYISKLKIKNFKCFDEVEIEFDPDFNLIIGENNSGKSTIFESLRLWQLAVQQFYMARTYKRTEGKYGFYRNNNFQPLNQSDLSFLRIDDLNNVLNNKIYSKIVNKHFEIEEDYKTFYIELTFSNGINKSKIPIAFYPGSRNTLYCKLNITEENELKELSESLSNVMGIATNDTFRNRIRLAYIPPKFNLPNKEVLLSDKNYILSDKLILGQSQLVIRNILHSWCEFDYQKYTKNVEEKNIRKAKNLLKTLKINETEFESNFNNSIKPYIESVLGFNLNHKKNNKSLFLTNIENGLMEILSQEFNFKSYNNPLRNPTLQIKNTKDNSEISQLGSGTINVLNILTVLNFNEQTIDKASTKCNILLLDEPDSHLHSNLQINLFNYLVGQSKENNKQIFIVTHNSSLISQFSNVLFIKNNQKIHKPIPISDYLEIHLKSIDENHYNVIKELNESKIKKEKIEKEIEKIKKPTLFCEGTSDVIILKAAYEKIYDQIFFDDKIEISGGGGASKVNNFLVHNSNDNITIIGLFDNDKEGKEHFDRLRKDGRGFDILNTTTPFHAVKITNGISHNKHALVLPKPSFRNSQWYDDNLFIEYMFNDNTLLKLKIELEKKDYLNFKTIKSMHGKDSKKDCDIEKQKICKNISILEKEDFNGFIPLFDKISEITGIELPKI